MTIPGQGLKLWDKVLSVDGHSCKDRKLIDVLTEIGSSPQHTIRLLRPHSSYVAKVAPPAEASTSAPAPAPAPAPTTPTPSTTKKLPAWRAAPHPPSEGAAAAAEAAPQPQQSTPPPVPGLNPEATGRIRLRADDDEDPVLQPGSAGRDVRARPLEPLGPLPPIGGKAPLPPIPAC